MEEKVKYLLSRFSALTKQEKEIVMRIGQPAFDFIEDIVSEEVLSDPNHLLNSMAKLSKNILGEYSQAVLVDIEDGIFLVDSEDMVVGAMLRQEGRYQKEEIEAIKSFINNDSKVLFVGAHIGVFAVPIARIVENIVCIEANLSSYKLLEYNMKLNNITNCKLYNTVAFNYDGEIDFIINRENSGGSKIVPFGNLDPYVTETSNIVELSCCRLDSLLKDQDFDVVIMDLEGAELFALLGMPKILEKVKLLFIEFIPHHIKNVAMIEISAFCEPLEIFDKLIIPELSKEIDKEDIPSVLKVFFECDKSFDSLIFKKK
ncbi:FkbM family methyltransferase [Sphingobacterium sp. ML3W]|uniref:FkbM family methyltransferase n=1 Tax=Sphingobacterium sp. ML3W TaxID=1538644 RepID=UPI00249A6932|nr:FkbM family methyltransferase [Sphingobacterium sp. ML3W]WFA78760.1 FkbM family methyltransferase [Sphingobacterium sp. ML3W]